MDDYVAKPIRAGGAGRGARRATPLAGGERRCRRSAVEPVSLDDAALENLRELGGDEFLRR